MVMSLRAVICLVLPYAGICFWRQRFHIEQRKVFMRISSVMDYVTGGLFAVWY
ncbi:hypothetical protein OH492_18905 [Vibrio chagasii]|nr:hypothetical protein [Vibrio chagasii]